MKVLKFIPYNKNLVPRARELRKVTTEAEKILWDKILKNKKFANLKFTRQKPIGHFIIDFYCSKVSLAIEVDGDIHKFQKIRDKERDDYLNEKFGLKVIRYKNEEILNNLDKIVEDLKRGIKRLTPP